MKKMLIWGMWTEQHSWGCCSAQVRGTMSLSTEFAAATAKSLQSCPTLRPHRRQPTRLHRPWDSPGKNTGVGCHFLLQCIRVKSKSEVAQSCPTPVPLVKNSFGEFSWKWSIFAKASVSNNNCLWTTKIFKDMVKDPILMQLTKKLLYCCDRTF